MTLASLTTATVTVTVIDGTDQDFPFDVMIDGELFDSFSTIQAAISTAISIFKQRAY